jgi:hypothetical protein
VIRILSAIRAVVNVSPPPPAAPETDESRVYGYAVRQVLARRQQYGPHPQVTAPWHRPENADRRRVMRGDPS